MAYDPFNAILTDPLLQALLQKITQSQRVTDPNIHLDPSTGAFTNYSDPYSLGEGPYAPPKLAPAEPLPVNESDVATIYALDQLHKQQELERNAAALKAQQAREDVVRQQTATNAQNLENTKGKNDFLKNQMMQMHQDLRDILTHPTAAGTFSPEQQTAIKNLQTQLANAANTLKSNNESPQVKSPMQIMKDEVDGELQTFGYNKDPVAAIAKARSQAEAENSKNPNPDMLKAINTYLDSKMPKTTAKPSPKGQPVTEIPSQAVTPDLQDAYQKALRQRLTPEQALDVARTARDYKDVLTPQPPSTTTQDYQNIITQFQQFDRTDHTKAMKYLQILWPNLPEEVRSYLRNPYVSPISRYVKNL